MGDQPQPAEVICRSDTRRDCLALALVLEAAGIRYEMRGDKGEFVLVVAATDAVRARVEIDTYARENRDRPAPDAAPSQRADGWTGVAGYAAVLLIVSIFTQRNTFDFDWVTAGKTHAALIRQGEWWRAITALTLHADPAHLVANLVIGGLIGLFAGQLLGSGLAWLSILFAGTVGNLLNAWVREPSHTSIGASTAVFAALGIVAACAWKRRRRMEGSRLARWTPLVGGVVLLGYLGTGGARTDVLAHVTGFLSGAALGAIYGTLADRMLLSARVQFLLGLCALAIVAFAWTLALAA
ncbi:MAG: rhomboid family intramembrane serine protease [Phycisphaerae bacterium]|nr:rhomboid family intramembrane serine protease [Phycisphaerae bacterium]